jgi:hypothetical protein
MKTKITAALIAVMLSPSLAFAMGGCSGEHKEITASSCKDGATWDAAKGACVLTPTT